MLRKETFFNSNRSFLVSGLLISVVLPFVTFTKTIWVKPSNENIDWSKFPASTPIENEVFEINWYLVFGIIYAIGMVLFLMKFAFDFFSLSKVLKGKTIQQQADFKFVDVTENISPFSYFNYIVYNSRLYTTTELENILEHEKVHSAQNHTIDVLISRLFCIVFWYNPFVWLYKKAIIQNLEYIADSEASKNISDKKAYQFTLLKITTQENCVEITNHFYQSLIKKRIVMLNKNQSNKRNSWKYATVIPALIAFVFLFQVKIVAQEKETTVIQEKNSNITAVVIDKNATEAEMKNDAKTLKEQHGITLKFSNVKRNNSGEITGIKVQYKDKEGNTGVNQFNGKDPIKPIHFYKTNTTIGFGEPNEVSMISLNENSNGSNEYSYSIHNDNENGEEIKVEVNAPEAPERPEFNENQEVPEVPEFPGHKVDKKIIVKRITNGNAKPIIILNGKRVDSDVDISDIDPEDISSVDVLKGNHAIKRYGSNGKNGAIVITTKEINKIRNEAMKNAHKDMEMARVEMEKARPEMELAKIEMEKAMQNMRPEMEKARAEMLQMKEEMIKAKAEMEKAKAELEKERAKIKKE